MHYLKLIFRASFILPVIFFYWFSGTSHSEYNANFKKISGEVKGPYIGFYEEYNLITNDTLEWTSNSYSKFMSLLREHKLTQSYSKFVNKVKTHDMTWDTNQIDSLIEMPTENEWNKIITTNEGTVYAADTLLYSEYAYPVEIPVKLSVNRSLYAHVYFYLGDNPDKLQIIFPDKNSEDNTKNLPGYVKGYMAKFGTSSSNFFDTKKYFQKLDEFINKHKILSASRLRPSLGGGRVYKIWDRNDKLIFEDEQGLEGLKYKTKIRQSIDVFESGINEDFVLWYDNWFVKLSIVFQLLIYLGVFFQIKSSVKKENEFPIK